MARIHGKNSDYSFNAVALEDELDEITMTADVPEADITSFNDTWQNFLAGDHLNVVDDIAGSFDPAASQGDATLFADIGVAATKSTVFDLTGSGPAASNPEYQCTSSGLTGSKVAHYSLDFPVGGRAGYRARIQHSGATTRAVA